MSIANELTRIVNAKNLIGQKAAELGLFYHNEETDAIVHVSLDEEGNPVDKIHHIATAINGINVYEPEFIEEHYMSLEVDETGNVEAEVILGGNMIVTGKVEITKQLDVQAETTITPTKEEQTAVAKGKFTTGDVKVAPIPDNYADISVVDASPETVLAGETFVDNQGRVRQGTMPDIESEDVVLDTNTTSYTIVHGCHTGSGTVSINPETKEATPTEETQTITPSSGKVLGSVTVNPIPDKYVDVSDTTKGSDDLVVTDAKVTVPSGYYPSGAEATVRTIDDVINEINPLTQSEIMFEVKGWLNYVEVSVSPELEAALAAI